MIDDPSLFVRLAGLSQFLEQQENFDESLTEFADMAAKALHTRNCSIMLFNQAEGEEDFQLRVFASAGYLPQLAYREAAKVREGIAGTVAATGKALLVEDITNSPYLPLARSPGGKSKCFMSAPIFIGTSVIGVLNLSNPSDARCFDRSDLLVAMMVALLVGKSIQVSQLQRILKSRFAQAALAQEAREAVSETLEARSLDPAQLARITGKTFYREMVRAGLGTDDIINAAAEIISLLNENLSRHRHRYEDQKRGREQELSGGDRPGRADTLPGN